MLLLEIDKLPLQGVDLTQTAGLWPSRIGVTKLFAGAIGAYPAMLPLRTPSQATNARDLAARTLAVATSPYLREATTRPYWR